MKKSFLLLALIPYLACCTGRKGVNNSGNTEDKKAKDLLQGIWINSDNDLPLMRVKGDTIYYTDAQNIPVYFKIFKDTLYTFGYTPASYLINKQTEHVFWFHSLSDNIIKLYKSDNCTDSLFFTEKSPEIIPNYTEVVKRDSVVYYNNTRYRAYTYINPSTMKVIKTSYSEDGLNVDHVYYDNIIHLCVYKGKDRIYAQNITKQMFTEIIPEDFLSGAMITDANFIHVTSSGFLYQANVCAPEDYICKLVNLTVSFDGNLRMAVAN